MNRSTLRSSATRNRQNMPAIAPFVVREPRDIRTNSGTIISQLIQNILGHVLPMIESSRPAREDLVDQFRVPDRALRVFWITPIKPVAHDALALAFHVGGFRHELGLLPFHAFACVVLRPP